VRGGAFGHSWTRVTRPLQAWTEATKPARSGEYQYWKILQDFRSGHRWDSTSKTPYVGIDRAGIEDDRFVPYENPSSIKAKRDYASRRGLAGLMVWELRGDRMPNGSHPLLNALR
jgi:GH18 family chitinase